MSTFPPTGPAPAAAPTAAIEVTTGFMFLAFLLYLFKPVISVDGVANKVNWGETHIPVAPGRHQVEVWLPYLFYKFMGRNGIVVDVAQGSVVKISWRSPWLVFLQGPIRVTDPGSAMGPAGAMPVAAVPGAVAAPVAGPAAAAAWHPDPSGRHELRYFDGAQWTEHVSDQGAASIDPPA
jgi:hypothetical protein